jgi:ACS family hexuronate transporter-like MFS transporter
MKNYIKLISWIVIFFAFFATALSFLDRQVVSLAILQIQEDLHISNIDYGFINTGFLISYCIMFTVGGVMIDRLGSRRGLGVSLAIWSLATLLHSVVGNALQLGAVRFLMGVGEGGIFTGAIKAVTEWIPKKRQGLANGIAIGGSAIGAVVAPLLYVCLTHIWGWRGVFIVTAGIGFTWVVGWFLLPKKKKEIEINPDVVPSDNESSVEPAVEPEVETKAPSFGKILKTKEVWVFVVIRFLLDPIFYFYMFWIPKYLSESRGMTVESIGSYLWIPFLALGVSNMLGGLISDKVMQKTGNINKARKIVMCAGALLTIPALLVKLAPSVGDVILILSIALFAHGLWITNYITSISDIFGKKATSTVVGLSGSAGALSSLIINPIIGLIVTKFSYNPMWIYAGAMYPVAFLIFVFLIPKVKLHKAFK